MAKGLRALTEEASSAAENERLNYFTRQVEFLVPYADSWSAAFQLNQILQKAGELKKSGNPEQAKALVQEQGIPLWLKLAPEVREAILSFQKVVSTRNDLGALAAIHNKYERVALVRLMASLKEYLREMPASLPASGGGGAPARCGQPAAGLYSYPAYDPDERNERANKRRRPRREEGGYTHSVHATFQCWNLDAEADEVAGSTDLRSGALGSGRWRAVLGLLRQRPTRDLLGNRQGDGA